MHFLQVLMIFVFYLCGDEKNETAIFHINSCIARLSVNANIDLCPWAINARDRNVVL